MLVFLNTAAWIWARIFTFSVSCMHFVQSLAALSVCPTHDKLTTPDSIIKLFLRACRPFSDCNFEALRWGITSNMTPFHLFREL